MGQWLATDRDIGLLRDLGVDAWWFTVGDEGEDEKDVELWLIGRC